jgi:hypothetical protein
MPVPKLQDLNFDPGVYLDNIYTLFLKSLVI